MKRKRQTERGPRGHKPSAARQSSRGLINTTTSNQIKFVDSPDTARPEKFVKQPPKPVLESGFKCRFSFRSEGATLTPNPRHRCDRKRLMARMIVAAAPEKPEEL